ncbi:glycosyltransferase family 2 protein [Candidatus Babeliales bacterium]|nr:glycosyltransferase family 2 protein [Candidatus Babeliales bacterium]
MKPKSNLSVIIVTRYASEWLELCLASLEKNSYYDNELIIVCDFPSWQTIKVLEDRLAKGQIFSYYPTAFGQYDLCCDYGDWKAHGEYVSICNDDVWFGPNWDKAIMDFMHPACFGSLFRYECNTGHGYIYDFGKLETFKEKEVLKLIEEHKHQPDHWQIGYPLVHHRENFFKYYGYTFHCTHGWGHERQLEHRQNYGTEELPPLEGYESKQGFQSAMYHFGATGNQDHMCSPVNNLKGERWALSEGWKICLGCGKNENGWGSTTDKEDYKKCDEVWKRGYWLCDKCKDAGIKDVKKFRPWDFWLREEVKE